MAAMVLPRSTPTPPPSVELPASIAPATPTSTPAMAIPGSNASKAAPLPIPNKHMASPNPGGIMKFTGPVTPPASPPGDQVDGKKCMDSLLYPPEKHISISSSPPLYAIDARGVAEALSYTSRQPLPDIEKMFPWAHGLHPENMIQLTFFYARKKSMRRPPTCYRGLCIVKVGRDLTKSRLKGAISPDEILPADTRTPGFLSVDPRDGFGVRNFHIQVGKFATISDLIVYGDEETDPALIMRTAKRLSNAQLQHRAMCQSNSARPFPEYNTFVVQEPFSVFENLFPELVAHDAEGNLTGQVVDLAHWERMEMCSMSRASEISKNVFLGSTADARRLAGPREHDWSVLIEASDLVPMPIPETFQDLTDTWNQGASQLYLEFPGSGNISPNWSRMDIEGIIDTCEWIYNMAHETEAEATVDSDGDEKMNGVSKRPPPRVLLHCPDGYTETSLLALAYVMYAELLPVHDAWVKLHTIKQRNFFAYDKDLAFLRYIERALLDAASRRRGACVDFASIKPPEWIYRMDGSLPSRILSYMYLGNLHHANNYGLLKALGIKRVLSIGEEVLWTEDERNQFGEDNVMVVRDLQDNGCDALQYQFWKCLDFIDEGHNRSEPVLVHCRVGVSRSATICIAEVMRTMRLSLPRAYCYVRARRLNVIIQPHLRFMYELLKFEESLAMKSYRAPRRELEWLHVARDIAAMNRPYTRQS